jgi:tetratricopeptide (TPR) repeat protein
MPPTSQKPQLSPAELAKLEHAFATEPASEAYRPLAEAYLGMGRFMEAMVVCKKGVKAHPNAADPRVLLARVYADQGKEKKAIEEVQGALQVAPTDKAALRLMGSLQIKSGEGEPGKSNLIKAYELDPNDADTLELMKQHGVAAPQKAPPPPPPPPPAPVQQAAQNGAVPHRNGSNGASAHVQAHAPAAHQQAPQQARPAGQQQQARPAQQQPRQQQRRPAYVEESQSGISEVSELPHRRKRSGSATVTIGILILAIIGGAAYWIIGHIIAIANQKAAQALNAAQKELHHDSYDSYKKAIDDAETALEAKPKSGPAHGILAYAHAIRWGEHGSADDRGGAEEHLAEALKFSDKPHSFTLAAEALIPYYSGDSKKALDIVAKNIEKTNGRSATLLLTQGIIMMNDGDLDGARDALEKAQQLAQDDARVYAAMGMLNRRRGFDREALQNFDTALRFEKGHADSIIGTAQLVLDLPDPGGGYISQAKQLKAVIDAQPPASPRQQALAHVLKALLISRVSNDMPLYPDADFQAKLADGTGVTKDKDKNKKAAEAEENQGFNIDPKNAELFLIRGKRLYFERNLDGAAAEIRKAITLAPTRVHYHVELAKVLFQKENADAEVEAQLRKSVSTFPDNPKLQTMLGQVLFKEGRVDDAISTLEKAAKSARETQSRLRMPEAFFTLGKIYHEKKKDNAKAIDAFQQASAQAFGDAMLGSQSNDELGMIFEEKNDKAAARANYEKAAVVDENVVATCHLARLLIKGGDAKDKDQIKILAKRYVENAPKGDCAAELKPLSQ